MERANEALEQPNKIEDAGRSGRIRWLRILVAGLAAEVAVMIMAVPTLWLPNPQQVLSIAIGPASFVAMLILGY